MIHFLVWSLCEVLQELLRFLEPLNLRSSCKDCHRAKESAKIIIKVTECHAGRCFLFANHKSIRLCIIQGTVKNIQ